MQVFGVPLSGGRRAAALVNKQPLGSPATMTLLWSDLGYPGSLRVHVEDAFTGRVISPAAMHNISFAVPPDDVALVTLTPLQDQLCSSDASPSWRLAALDTPDHELALDQGVLSGRLGGSSALRDSMQAGEHCVRLSTLDRWRPWHHGFFGPGTEH